ncbi:MAG: hypothetical protein AVO35_02265 [Candidatus Aegiribacteria sp. MLS_C]|nr:MAG: hypothetical protein AVO35_02265 [Candidatus Aegiribacteria sp. MLS_C]
MSFGRPPDRRIRDAILTETERNVTVHAGAGTGKTTLMVERVVELVKSGVPVDRLAVVTFTDAAAAELRLRIRQRLREESDGGSARCRTALGGIGSAWISTIHGFASRVLREYFNLTGVDPSFTTTETHFTPSDLDREWDAWLMDLVPGPEELEVMGETGTGTQKGIALGIEQRRWLSSVDHTGDEETVRELVEEFMAVHGPRVEKVLSLCSDPGDKLFARGVEFLEGLECLAGQLPLPDPVLIDSIGRMVHLGCGSAAAWEDLDLAKSVLGEARDRFREMAVVLGSGRLTRLTWKVAGVFAEELTGKWDADRSRLSYDDLLHFALRAVAGDGRLAGLLAGRFDHVLIDEFQDTSREQTELFLAFMQEGGGIPGGRMTIVADDKQSIYGWRNADIETYNRFRRGLEEGGALSASITTNFRSTVSIVRFINSFGRVLFSDRRPEEEPFSCDYSPIEARPGAPEGDAVRVLRLPSLPEGSSKNRSERSWLASVQADWFAGEVLRGLGTGGRPEDYALLLRAGTHTHAFVDALERAGIPYRVGAARDFLRRQEIADLREMVRCLLYPGDRMAWVHTLRSLFFGIPDDQVTEALRSGADGYLSATGGQGTAVFSANAALRSLRNAILALPLGDFLTELLYTSPMVPVICATGHQVSRRLGNIQHLLELVVSGVVHSPMELLELLDERLSPRKPEEPPRVPVEGGAVTLTTIHSAKGLDWKHVVLASMPVRRKGTSGAVISYDHGRMAAFDFGICSGNGEGCRVRSPYWPQIVGIEKARELAESRRLVYVAVTRARETLTILAEPVEKGGDSDAAILWSGLERALEEDPGCMVIEDLVPEETSAPVVPAPGRTPPSGGAAIETPGEELFPVDPSPSGWRSRGAELGDLVHRVMEKMDFGDPGGWLERNGAGLRELCGPDLDRVRGFCLSFFRMELPFDLAGSRILGREYPYIVSTPAGPRQRYVDLLLRTPDGVLTVVDYKTDDLDLPGSEEVVAGYMETQRGYVSDLDRAFGEEVRGYLVFLRHCRAMEVR